MINDNERAKNKPFKMSTLREEIKNNQHQNNKIITNK